MNMNVTARLLRTTDKGRYVWGLSIGVPEWLMREMGSLFGQKHTWRIANWGGQYSGTEDGGHCSFLLLLVPPSEMTDESEADHDTV